jgi:hypothetical protein
LPNPYSAYEAQGEEGKDEGGDMWMKKHKPLTKLSENIVQNIKDIESEFKSRKKDKDKKEKKIDIKEF